MRAGVFKLLMLVWRIKPEVILSGMFHLNFLVLLLRPLFPRGTLVLVRQNGTVSAHSLAEICPVYTRLLYRLLYRRADRVICQTEAMAKDLINQLGIRPERLAVLCKSVGYRVRSETTASSSPVRWTERTSAGPGPHLLAVGRLSKEKGFDLLLRALAVVAPTVSEHQIFSS